MPAVEDSDHFLQFPVLLEQWMCVHTAHGDRRKGVSAWLSLDFVKHFHSDMRSATCFPGKSTGVAQIQVQCLSAMDYLCSLGEIFSFPGPILLPYKVPSLSEILQL